MRACSYLNVVAACGIVTVMSFAGCGGAETPPPESATAGEPSPASETEPTAAAPASESGSGEESLMGSDDPANNPSAASDKGGGPAPGEDTRTVEVIRKAVMEHRPIIRKCYEDALKELPGLQGDLVVQFVLDPEGKVKKAELNQERSTLKSPKVVECAINVIKGIKFPPSSRGMEATTNYPFNFKPGT
jgi:hypothetical protein